jgi:hypothetical protein
MLYVWQDGWGGDCESQRCEDSYGATKNQANGYKVRLKGAEKENGKGEKKQETMREKHTTTQNTTLFVGLCLWLGSTAAATSSKTWLLF